MYFSGSIFPVKHKVCCCPLHSVPSLTPSHLFVLIPFRQAVEAKLSLDALLQMTGAQVRDAMRRLGSSSEECGRLGAALSCLKSATESGMSTHC